MFKLVLCIMKLEKSKIRVQKNKKGQVEKIFYQDFDFFSWPYEEQTKIKHFVFEEYFKAWTTILGAFKGKINYFDGFGGCGSYIELEKNNHYFGSPVLAANIVKNNKFKSEVLIIVIEENKENIENLKKV